MLTAARRKPPCVNCSRHVLELFVSGLVATPVKRLPRVRPSVAIAQSTRKFHSIRSLRQENGPLLEQPSQEDGAQLSLDQLRELKAREARQRFGNSLPVDHLTVEEYQVYERLYGAPLEFTRPEDEELLEPVREEDGELQIETDLPAPNQNVLLREVEDGILEEVEYEQQVSEDPDPGQEEIEAERGQSSSDGKEGAESKAALDEQDLWMVQDLEAARVLAEEQLGLKESSTEGRWHDTYPEENDEAEEEFARTHPLTEAARFATYPRSVSLPAREFTQPIQEHLADRAKYEHLIQGASKIFGGRSLPDSNATPPKKGRQFEQKPIPLDASQFNMTQMEANLFLTCIMPGAYASTMSILVEIRKRLGTDWISELLSKPGGPRVLDAGGGGAGVIAWREVLKAEWNRLHEASGRISQNELHLGSATVLAGSRELRGAVSQFLDNTTFIPRLPEFNRLTDTGSLGMSSAPARKQYDLIIAPYSLWQLEEDYMKKNHVQNLWSLLDPKGGVLVLLEKGLPRGFEAIAGAREVLLSHHIRNPQLDVQAKMEAADHKHTHMEEGMIIAPCTNHTKCPLYKIPGEMTGRRDFCSFEQRFERPPFLQRIHDARFRNHEDISFSYLAVRRGRDSRRDLGFRQDAASTQAAFAGYEHALEGKASFSASSQNVRAQDEASKDEVREQQPASAPLLSLPRIMRPPIKRTGHVTFDMCTAEGTFERWTTPKSFSRQAYRDARKARWGDLWALGAKTRREQAVQTGRPKGSSRPSKVLQALDELAAADAADDIAGDGESGAASSDPVLRRILAAGEKNKKANKVKRGDKGWKAHIGRRDKYGDSPKTRKADRKVGELLDEL